MPTVLSINRSQGSNPPVPVENVRLQIDSGLSRGGSGFLQEARQDQREKDAVEERRESSLIVRQGHHIVIAGLLDQPRSKYRPKQRAEGEIEEVDHTSSRPAQFWWVGFLDNGANKKLPCRPASHTEHLRSADKRRSHGHWEVLGDDIYGADQREDAAGTCRNLPMLAAAMLPVPNNSAPTPTIAAPIGMIRFAPKRSMAAPATRLNGE